MILRYVNKKQIVKQLLFMSTIIFLTATFVVSEDLVIEIDNPKFTEKGLNDKVSK